MVLGRILASCWRGFLLSLGTALCVPAVASSLSGVFDAGWSTGYYSQDSITHMHRRLHDAGASVVVLQYGAVEKTHLYYPSNLDFLQNTTYRHDDFFEKSVVAAQASGNRLWLGLYYDGSDWYTPPTVDALDTLAARNLKVLDELHALFGKETVVEGVYIPQEVARYYWDGLRDDATAESLVSHFLKPVTDAAKSKGWKVMAAPFFNRNLETPEKLQAFFEKLFAAGFEPSVIAVQDGIGASDAGVHHATLDSLGLYLRAVSAACKRYSVEFWIDAELFESNENAVLAESSRIKAQVDTARAAGATKVVGYDLSVLKDSGLDSLKAWYEPEGDSSTGIRKPGARSIKLGDAPVRYRKADGALADDPRTRIRKFAVPAIR